MTDKFWCLACGNEVEGKKEVREFPSGGRTMVLTTVHCAVCGIALERSSTMKDLRGVDGKV